MSSRGRGRGRGRGSSAELLRDVNEDIGAQTEIARDKSPPRYPAAFEVPEVQLITLSDQNARESFHRHLRNRDSQPAVFDVSNCPYDSKLLMGLLTSNLLLPPRPLKRKVVRAPILPKRLRADSNISLTAAETGKDGMYYFLLELFQIQNILIFFLHRLKSC
uniref:Uncharacterized protein n=1 Tax=Aureoumbra lagunensis TaxID=44058 RepID=A0A7S3NHX0_9STRA